MPSETTPWDIVRYHKRPFPHNSLDYSNNTSARLPARLEKQVEQDSVIVFVVWIVARVVISLVVESLFLRGLVPLKLNSFSVCRGLLVWVRFEWLLLSW